jgi:thymidylate synthase ThyX
MMSRAFTPAEAIVLGHFFTSTDASVYCATDHLPTALWAFLEGGYSRSQLSMRERFLQIFEEMQDEVAAGRLRREEAPTIEELAESISAGHAPMLGLALERASRFMSKWAVEYGHNSLKDGAIDRFAVEGLSQRATKILESMPLGAYQEKSTRYLDFSRDLLVFPPRLLASSFGEEAQWQSGLMMKAYREVLAALSEHYSSVLPRNEFRSDAAWKRTAQAKAFDSARYLLPLSVKTSLGITLPTRETERLLSTMLASPNEEIKALGEAMHLEAVKVNPGLLRHVRANGYLERSQGAVVALCHELPAATKAPEGEFGARLLWATPHIETLALAATLGATEASLHDMERLQEIVRAGGVELAARIAAAALEGRGPHDEWPRELAVGQLGFDLVMDFGAYRDLQRHRVGMQLRVKPTTMLGYAIPPVLDEPSLATARDTYCRAMERMTELNRRVAAELPVEAEYLTALGHLCRFTYACDLRQWAYLVELRSGPSGHASYRRIAHEMARAALPLVPQFSRYLRVDWSGEVDRRQAEERTQKKIAALQGGA